MTIAYVDTSALVKLVVAEAETEALRAWLGERAAGDVVATSELTAIELPRAARRHSREAAEAAQQVLRSVDRVAIGPAVIQRAAAMEPSPLRSLDAIHLATALLIGSSLSAFVAYDARLVGAAQAAGAVVVSPR